MSNRYEAVDCPLCAHPALWEGAATCPGCLGGRRISRFKAAELYLRFPELAKIDTLPEMKAVRPEESS